jgi:hypothetical protein
MAENPAVATAGTPSTLPAERTTATEDDSKSRDSSHSRDFRDVNSSKNKSISRDASTSTGYDNSCRRNANNSRGNKQKQRQLEHYARNNISDTSNGRDVSSSRDTSNTSVTSYFANQEASNVAFLTKMSDKKVQQPFLVRYFV